jgi:hypothetical protein
LENPYGRKEIHQSVTDFNKLTNVDHIGARWPILVDIFDRDWWQRVWVRQEIAMSQRAVVLCRDGSVVWEDVAAVCHWVKMFVADLDAKTRNYGAMRRSGAYSGDDLEYFRQTLKTKGKVDFRTLLIHARDCEATDPRDKVFAILGMVGDSQGDIPIDYGQPVSEVAKQAFKKLVSLSNGLEALIFSQNPNRQQGIPSWAPNLCSSFNAQPSRLKGLSSSLYAATRGSVEGYKFLADGITLEVRGMIFDTVQNVSMTTLLSKNTPTLEFDAVICGWRNLVFGWLNSMDIDHKYEHLMRILTCDRDIRGRRLGSQVNNLDWGTFFRIEHLGVGARREFEYLAAAVRGGRFEGGVTDETEVNAWLRLCGESIANKRVVVTSSGRLGLVPAETQRGDRVCLIMGLDVPFVLRTSNFDSYILIGEAYIHGAMDGEILVNGNIRSEDIKSR